MKALIWTKLLFFKVVIGQYYYNPSYYPSNYVVPSAPASVPSPYNSPYLAPRKLPIVPCVSSPSCPLTKHCEPPPVQVSKHTSPSIPSVSSPVNTMPSSPRCSYGTATFLPSSISQTPKATFLSQNFGQAQSSEKPVVTPQLPPATYPCPFCRGEVPSKDLDIPPPPPPAPMLPGILNQLPPINKIACSKTTEEEEQVASHFINPVPEIKLNKFRRNRDKVEKCRNKIKEDIFDIFEAKPCKRRHDECPSHNEESRRSRFDLDLLDGFLSCL